jgi:Protein-tyrosine-phosphatase
MTIRAPFKILFLCTGNSARSIFGEYLIRKLGKGRFKSYSAGADPRRRINPYALRVLQESFKIDASEARPKSWDVYKDVIFDFVITVCDHAKETCPVWPGQPITAPLWRREPGSVGHSRGCAGRSTGDAFSLQHMRPFADLVRATLASRVMP